MKKLLFTCFIFALLAIITSCSKDKQELMDTAWKIESVKVHADSIWQYPKIGVWEDEFMLKFIKRNKYTFVTCSGKVKFSTNQKIVFKSESCLGLGGYSELSLRCYDIMCSQITHYKLSDNMFILKGDHGEVINFIKAD